MIPYISYDFIAPSRYRRHSQFRLFGCFVVVMMFILVLIIGGRNAFAYEPPFHARNNGYFINTFSSVFNNASVDWAQTHQSGFSWYLWSFFSGQAQPDRIKLNNDGSITLLGDDTGPNGQIATIASKKNSAKFVGQAFGGGAYIEAELKFNPMDVISANAKGWPAFWAMSAEHLIEKGEQWVGKQNGYAHFIEVDFFEYDVVRKGEPLNHYGVNLHDWYGKYNTTCSGRAFCQSSLPYSKVKVTVPEETNFSEYHRYGFLWLPATSEKKGIGRFYFDDKQVGGDVEWEKFSHQQEIPDPHPWRFGIIDKQHLVLILGTGRNQPMTVRSVNVWQVSGNQNLHY